MNTVPRLSTADIKANFVASLMFDPHEKGILFLYFFLFDKQQYHVCHFDVDTIIRLSVILQYFKFLCPLRYI